MRFDRPLLERVALGAAAVLLSACSASNPPRPAPEPAVVDAEPEARAQSPADSRADRRERRRQRDAAESGEQDAGVPERALLTYERALAAMRSQNWVEAEFELEQLVLEFPEFPGPFVNLAIVYMQDTRTDEAMDALAQALAIDPAHAAANNELAILLREQGRFEAAEQAYRQALQSDPGYPLALYNLGVLLDLYLGRQAEALELYEQYQALLTEPDPEVGRWIIDLRRRVGAADEARVAQEDGL